MQKIRLPLADGILYPSDPDELNAYVARLLKQTAPAAPDNSMETDAAPPALIVPHGWYDLCGAVMAEAYARLPQEDIGRVVLTGPVHREFGRFLCLPESTIFSLSGHAINVDTQAVEQLLHIDDMFIRDNIPHTEEHCIEVQLPFIRHLCPDAEIVPILFGESSRKTAEACAKGLASLPAPGNGKTLFIATTNMADNSDTDCAVAEAEGFLRLTEAADWKKIIHQDNRKLTSACCPGAVSALLHPDLGFSPPRLLSRSDSGAAEGPSEGIVCYASFLLESPLLKCSSLKSHG